MKPSRSPVYPGLRSPGIVCVCLLLGCLAVLGKPPAPASAYSDSQFFPETGFTVKGAFKVYWERQGGLEQFGFPLTNQFRQYSPGQPDKAYLTQYFQRAIFENHPEKAGTEYEVLLRLVGNLSTTGQGRSFPKGSPSQALSNRGYFWQTGHTLGDRFLTHWRESGGLATYGYPISEEIIEVNSADGKAYTVQYFERARFEYHPENSGSRYEILLGFLGWQELKLCDVPTDPNFIGQPYRRLGPAVESPDPALSPAPLPTPAPVITPGVQPVTPPPTPETPTQNAPLTITPLKAPFGRGINVWVYGQGTQRERILGLVRAAGFNYVRQQLRWDYIETKPGVYEWSELDQVVEAITAKDLKLVLSVAKAPVWAGTGPEHLGLPANPDDFKRFMDQVSQRYKGRVLAYEIWNEPNIAREAGEVQIGRYVNTLKAGYTAIKKNDAEAVVITGGTTPTGVDRPGDVIDDVEFVRQCYQYNQGEWRNYFDVLGVHPGGAANSPDEFWPDDAPLDKTRPFTTHPSFYFRRFENHREIMVKNGDGDKQIWLTEFGWTTKNNTPGFEFGILNTEQQQANFEVAAFLRARNYQYLGVVLLWNLNFATLPTINADDQESGFSLLRSDYSLRPAYMALQKLLTTVQP